MEKMRNITGISRIGHIKRTGNEWSTLRTDFVLDACPEEAVIRVESEGVCGIFLNGSFAEASTGRLPERVTCIEVTSLLKKGKNTLSLRLGAHYFQTLAKENRERRGAWISFAAAELRITAAGQTRTVVTDGSWEIESDGGQTVPEVFSQVTALEYEQFWRHAALWRERKKLTVPQAVLQVAGQGYADYLAAEEPEYDLPKAVVSSNILFPDGAPAADPDNTADALPYVIYDFGRLTVGYLELEYQAAAAGSAVFAFDYTESADDFDETRDMRPVVRNLMIESKTEKGRGSIFLLRRRAFRFLKISFSAYDPSFRPEKVRVRRCMAPTAQKGWFCCEEELLNRAWEVGKYTLHVNKHQEYESCPRNEMKFFSGDGIIDALTDYYTFGDLELADASLCLQHNEVDNGIACSPFNRLSGLWDYYAWRIIMAANHYRFSGDADFLKRHYDSLVMSLRWMIERMGADGLIWQLPVYDTTFATFCDCVEYTGGADRLGKKAYLNALYYQALREMAWLGQLRRDARSAEWTQLADTVYRAFNEQLWNAQLNAYTDSLDRSVVPQDGNALAVLFGLAEGERAALALQTLRERNWSPYGSSILDQSPSYFPTGAQTISPAMNTHEAAARFGSGDADGGMELIRRCWGTMLNKGAGTFWEYAPNNATERWPIPSHAWSGGCAYLLSAYGLGVRPAEPGYRKAVFQPYPGFARFAGVIPTAAGVIAVRGEQKNGRPCYTVAAPKAMELELRIPDGASFTRIDY